MKAFMYYPDNELGTRFEVEEIPANMIEEAEEWRAKMIEAVAEVDDTLLERFLGDQDSITAEEIITASKKISNSGSGNSCNMWFRI